MQDFVHQPYLSLSLLCLAETTQAADTALGGPATQLWGLQELAHVSGAQ